MSKHHHQDKEEQINNRLDKVARFQQEHAAYPPSPTTPTTELEKSVAVEENSIQQRAYQIFTERGGSALDNWLEAERILKNNNSTVSSFVNEGNPNTQK